MTSWAPRGALHSRHQNGKGMLSHPRQGFEHGVSSSHDRTFTPAPSAVVPAPVLCCCYSLWRMLGCSMDSLYIVYHWTNLIEASLGFTMLSVVTPKLNLRYFRFRRENNIILFFVLVLLSTCCFCATFLSQHHLLAIFQFFILIMNPSKLVDLKKKITRLFESHLCASP